MIDVVTEVCAAPSIEYCFACVCGWGRPHFGRCALVCAFTLAACVVYALVRAPGVRFGGGLQSAAGCTPLSLLFVVPDGRRWCVGGVTSELYMCPCAGGDHHGGPHAVGPHLRTGRTLPRVAGHQEALRVRRHCRCTRVQHVTCIVDCACVALHASLPAARHSNLTLFCFSSMTFAKLGFS